VPHMAMFHVGSFRHNQTPANPLTDHIAVVLSVPLHRNTKDLNRYHI